MVIVCSAKFHQVCQYNMIVRNEGRHSIVVKAYVTPWRTIGNSLVLCKTFSL